MISEKDITYCLNSFLKNDDCNCNACGKLGTSNCRLICLEVEKNVIK